MISIETLKQSLPDYSKVIDALMEPSDSIVFKEYYALIHKTLKEMKNNRLIEYSDYLLISRDLNQAVANVRETLALIDENDKNQRNSNTMEF